MIIVIFIEFLLVFYRLFIYIQFLLISIHLNSYELIFNWFNWIFIEFLLLFYLLFI